MKYLIILIAITACHTAKPVAIKAKVPCHSKAGNVKRDYYNKLQYN